MRNSLYKSALYISTAIGIGLSTQAFAQNSSGGAEVSTSMADIVVTARRIEERLQDVPISITVFNQEQLSRENVFSAKDLATYTPSLYAQTRYGSDFASFAIRGFTQEARTTASVGVYFADVVVPRSSPLSASGDGAGPGAMFDLQNVQVLKGPQGTLFGRNTTGGAVVLMPQRPTSKLEGYVEGSYGNYDMRRLQAVLNVPVSDTFRIRGGVDWQKRDGYLKNIAEYADGTSVGPKDFADVNYVAARLSAVADLSPDVENYTVLSYTKSDTNGAIPKVTDCYNGIGQAGVIPNGQFNYACQQIEREKAYGDYAVSNWLPFAYQRVETIQIINQTKWMASDTLTVKNIMSYGEVTQDQSNNLFGTYNPVGTGIVWDNSTSSWVPANGGMTLPTSTAPYYTNITPSSQYLGLGWGFATSMSPVGKHAGHQSTFTEELQFQGRSEDDKLNWQAGIYYERSKPLGWSGTQSMDGVLCSQDDYMEEWANFACTDASIITGSSRPTGTRNYQVGKVNYRNVGLYAQGTYEFTPQFSIDAGIRYTWDKSWGQGQRVTVNYSAATGWNTPSFQCLGDTLSYPTLEGATAGCSKNYKQTSKAPTWMLGLNFKPVEDVLVYAKWSRGYRQGSIQPIAAYGFETYKPEKVDVYEGGLKTSFRGAISGTFNIAGFYNDFKNMQMQIAFVDRNQTSPSLSPGPAIVNVGKARIYGFEADASLNLLDGLTLTAAYSYINTKIKSFATPEKDSITGTYGGLPGGYDTLSFAIGEGDPLPYTPKHKLTLGANYRLPLPDTAGKLSVGATMAYTGKIFYGRNLYQYLWYDSIFSSSPGNCTASNCSVNVSPGHTTVNLNVNWDKVMGSPIDAQFFMTNVFDKTYYDARSLNGTSGFVSRYLGEPRMYGLRLKYKFGE